MAFTLGTLYATDATGWSTYTISSFGVGTAYTGSGTRIICVSNAGNDNTGDGTQGNPYATPRVANTHIRDGFPDWLLLRRGDTFDDSTDNFQIRYSGPSSSLPILISNYDNATFNPSAPTFDPAVSSQPRPIWHSPQGAALGSACITGQGGAGAPADSGNNIAIIGIDFYSPTRDPNSGSFNSSDVNRISMIGISWGYLFTFLVIENCRFRWLAEAIDMFTGDLTTQSTGLHIRRNVISNCYIGSGNGAAIHLAGNSHPTLDENFIDKSWNDTWTSTGSLGFIHNFYHSVYENEFAPNSTSLGAICNGNVFSRDPSAIQFRGGIQIVNNLFVANPQAGSIGYVSLEQPVISDNVITEGVGNFGQPGGSGFISNFDVNYNHATTPFSYANNYFVNPQTAGNGLDIRGGYSGTVSNNVFFKYDTAGSLSYSLQTGGVMSYGAITAGTGYSAYPSFTGFIDDGGGAPSTSSNTISLGSKTFTVATSAAALTGQPLLAFDNISGQFMQGSVTSYSGSSLVMTATASSTVGVTSTNWSLVGVYDGTPGIGLTITTVSGTPVVSNVQITWPGMATSTYVNIFETPGALPGGVGTGYLVIMNSTRSNTFTVPPTTFTFNNYFLAMTGGSGTSALAMIKVTTGQVSSVQMWDGVADADHPTVNPGFGYSSGDSLTAAVPGGTGFSVIVGTLSNIANINNTTSGKFLDTSRTVGKYMQTFGLGTGLPDFFTAIANQEKANWNTQLTADVINDWIQTGFTLLISGGDRSWLGRF